LNCHITGPHEDPNHRILHAIESAEKAVLHAVEEEVNSLFHAMDHHHDEKAGNALKKGISKTNDKVKERHENRRKQFQERSSSLIDEYLMWEFE
jgi:hypothetical protein